MTQNAGIAGSRETGPSARRSSLSAGSREYPGFLLHQNGGDMQDETAICRLISYCPRPETGAA